MKTYQQILNSIQEARIQRDKERVDRSIENLESFLRLRIIQAYPHNPPAVVVQSIFSSTPVGTDEYQVFRCDEDIISALKEELDKAGYTVAVEKDRNGMVLIVTRGEK